MEPSFYSMLLCQYYFGANLQVMGYALHSIFVFEDHWSVEVKQERKVKESS